MSLLNELLTLKKCVTMTESVQRRPDDHYTHSDGNVEITVDADDPYEIEATICQKFPAGKTRIQQMSAEDLDEFNANQDREYGPWLMEVLSLYDVDLYDGTPSDGPYEEDGMICLHLEFPPQD